MSGLLLDTHVLYWRVSDIDRVPMEAIIAIQDSSGNRKLYVSPISAWELANASFKPAHKNPPDLGPGPPSVWFMNAVCSAGARIVPIHQRIASAAADVARETGHKDPGDCYLIATARVRKVPIVTRDAVMIALSKAGYVDVVPC